MGLPNILIEFKSTASTAVSRGERGIVAIMLVDEDLEATKVTKIEDATGIPTDLSDDNTAYVERCFLGGYEPVNYVQLIEAASIADALAALEVTKFDYVVAPPDVSASDAATVATYIKAMRDSKNIMVKAVLPNIKGDHKGIINFTTTDIVVGDDTFTTAEYCSRIAGALAGTPLDLSCTYYVLTEVDDVPKFTKSEMDTKINAGELALYHDGEKVKIARGVNSLQTLVGDVNEDHKSIKFVDIMDLIYTDIKTTCEDVYIGKFPNNYSNKCLLIVAIQTYLEALRDEGLLDTSIVTEIDVTSQTAYLKTKGVDTSSLSEQEIKEYNTQSYVFLQSTYKILYAIEDITINFYV